MRLRRATRRATNDRRRRRIRTFGSPSRCWCTRSWCCSSASASTCTRPATPTWRARSPGAAASAVDRRRHGRRRGRPRDRRRSREAGRGAQGRGGARRRSESVHPPGQVVDLPTPREEKRPDRREVRLRARQPGRARDEEVRPLRGQRPAGRPRAARRRRRSRRAAGRRAAGDAHARSRSVPARRRARRARRRAPGARGRATARPIPASPSRTGASPELGAEARPRPGGGGRAAAPDRRWCRPSSSWRARSAGGTQDALRDVDDGDETALNSKRWRFASFFNRVKRQVAEHWHPDEVYRQRDPTGTVYGRRNRYTELRIQLKPDGRLSNVALAPAERASSSSTTRRSRRSRRRRRSRIRRASSSRRTGSSTSASASCSTSTDRRRCAGSATTTDRRRRS